MNKYSERAGILSALSLYQIYAKNSSFIIDSQKKIRYYVSREISCIRTWRVVVFQKEEEQVMKDAQATFPQRAHWRFWQNGPQYIRWYGLQARMTRSYIWVTALLVLLIEILVGLLLVFVLNIWIGDMNFSLAQKTAVQYAYAASLQSAGQKLNPHATFQPGQADSLMPPGQSVPGKNAYKTLPLSTLVIPYVSGSHPDQSSIELALLIAPNGNWPDRMRAWQNVTASRVNSTTQSPRTSFRCVC